MIEERAKTTGFLSKLLEKHLFHRGNNWASEVVLDYGTKDCKRVDYLEIIPADRTMSGIEKSTFAAYEVKSCKADLKSGYGLNFIAEKNYLVMTMETYKNVLDELRTDRKYDKVGVYVAVPDTSNKIAEFDNPTPIDYNPQKWHLENVKSAYLKQRKKPVIELMYVILSRCTCIC